MFDFNRFYQADETDYKGILTDIAAGKAQLVDIREQNEWDYGHFKEAIHIPLSKLAKGAGIDQLRKLREENKKIYLHCRTGSRVMMAERLLPQFGCKEFSILPTDMNVMAANGFQYIQ